MASRWPRRRQVSSFILLSVGFGIIYWFLECLIDVFIFYEGGRAISVLTHGNFSQRLLNRLSDPSPQEVWVRLLVMLAFVLFGAFVQHTVTGRLSAEEQLRKLNEELEARVAERTAQLEATNKELKAYDYTVSHELRSPVRAIRSLAKGALERPPGEPGADVGHLIREVLGSAELMHRKIEDLLAFSQAGRRDFQVSEFDMGELAQIVFNDLQTAYPDGRASLEATSELKVRADLSMLREAMMNLIGNALKFSHTQEKAVVSVGGYVDDARAEHVYYVRDNGVGFDPSRAGEVFDVFRRLHSAEDFEGTGVGLAIVQRIIERHGGRVWAEGAVDQGATIYFTLPQVQETAKS